ncbi:MAG: conjugal transfer protein TrbD [Succinatimonas hippei]|nr:conjugal transfer protein TrbD [Succinatimonas hippei]
MPDIENHDVELRPARIFSVGSRDPLLLGCDRRLLLLSAFLLLGEGWAWSNIPAVVCCLVLWIVFLGLFRKMGKADGKLLDVYLRSLHYKPFYFAKSTPWNQSNKIYHGFFK